MLASAIRTLFISRSRFFPWPFDTRPAEGDGHSPESSLLVIVGTTESVVDGVRKTFLRNKANLEQPLSHLEDTPHVKCEHEAKAAAGMGDSTEFDTSVEKCRKVSNSVGWVKAPPRAVGVALIAFICNGIAGGSGSRQGARGGPCRRKPECRVEMSNARRRRRAARVKKSDDL